jgi:hypothetical protein
MKRQVYVPFFLLKNGQIPEEAVDLSKQTQLGIQIGKEEDNFYNKLQVIQIPEKQFINYRKKVHLGYIQSIEYVDEFFAFDKSTKLELIYPCGKRINPKPRIKEKHMLSYKERLSDKGEYFFFITTIIDGNVKNLAEGFFEVI